MALTGQQGNDRQQLQTERGRPAFPREWWLSGYRAPGEHHAMLDAKGSWPGAMVGLRAARFRPAAPTSAPPLWWPSNATVTYNGAYMRVPKTFVQNKLGIAQRHLQSIGPTDTSTQRGMALQAALAAQLRGGK